MKFSTTVTEPYSTTNLNIANHQFLILFSDFAHSKATKIQEKSALDERSYNVYAQRPSTVQSTERVDRPFVLNINKPSTVTSAPANDPSFITMNTQMKCCTVPETQFGQESKEVEKSNVGPSSVPATQLNFKMASESSTINVIPETQSKNIVSLSIDDLHSDNDDGASEVDTQADLFEEEQPVDMATIDAEAADRGSTDPGNLESDSEFSQRTGDFQCSRCFSEFQDYLVYTRHINSCQGPKRRYRCIQPSCSQEFSQRSIMMQHNRSIHLHQPFICQEKNCNHRYNSQKVLKAHIKEHHDKLFKFKCTICGQKFVHKSQYNTHLTRHTNIKPFACNHCKKASYTTAAQLTQHVTICMFGTPYCCEMCGKSCSSQTTLKQHVQNVHAKTADFRCDLCLKIYKQYASLWKHRRDKHSK